MARGKKSGNRPIKEKTSKRLGRVQEASGLDLLVRLGYREPPPPPKTPEELAAERIAFDRQNYLIGIARNPVPRFKTRSGSVMFQRLGHLNAVRQRRGMTADSAPESRGVWAFPWPAGDIGFYAGHKWQEVLPKRLTRAAFEALYARYEEAEGEERERLGQELEAHHDERERWIKEVGPRVMSIKKFWYGGVLYSRLTLKGEILPYYEDRRQRWTRMTVGQFLEAARKGPIGYGTDHLEVFIPGSVS